MSIIYLAAPLFTAAERAFNHRLRDALVEAGYQVDLPQESTAHLKDLQEIYNRCIQGVETSDLILALVGPPAASTSP
ncbi:MAG: nucleoside 2-deoxyribosyltransferase [Thermodesulfobacteriota bacterium]